MMFYVLCNDLPQWSEVQWFLAPSWSCCSCSGRPRGLISPWYYHIHIWWWWWCWLCWWWWWCDNGDGDTLRYIKPWNRSTAFSPARRGLSQVSLVVSCIVLYHIIIIELYHYHYQLSLIVSVLSCIIIIGHHGWISIKITRPRVMLGTS